MSMGLGTRMRRLPAAAIRATGLSIAAALLMSAGAAVAQTAPPIVMSSALANTASGMQFPTKVVQDSCGDLYEMEAGSTLMEIPAGSDTATAVALPATLAGGSYGLATDASNLYVGGMQSDYSNGHVWMIPIAGCVAQVSKATDIGAASANVGNGAGNVGWYYAPADIATDGSGNVFFSTSAACCTAANNYWIVELTPGGGAVAVLSAFTGEATSVAVDAQDNVYFTSGGIVYEVPYSGGAYAANPTAVISSGLSNPYGLAFDAAGNLYVGDTGAGKIYEVPVSGGTLQFGQMYLVAGGLTFGSPLSAGLTNTNSLELFYSGNAPGGYTTYGSFNQLTVGSANLGSSAVGSSATGMLNVAFNSDEKPGSIGIAGSGSAFSLGSGSCAAGTSYTSGQSCTIDLSWQPTMPGVQQAAVALADGSGNRLAMATVFGTGLGAGLTVDPGTATGVGGGLNSPEGVAVDMAGDVFIADPGANAVDEFTPGSTTAVSIGTGLSAPAGVAVDAAGDVLIADTGNDRIVEVPVVSGTLSNSAQIVAVSGKIAGSALSSPEGVSVDAAGNLYIADTGNNRVVLVPWNGSFETSAAMEIGSGFKAPEAVEADDSGNVYIADSGNGKVERVPWPVSLGQVQLIAASLSGPSALALDASGSLYVVNAGNQQILRIPNESGSLVQNDAVDVTAGIQAPWGLAMDGAGDLYVTDNTNAAAWEVTRTSTTLTFGFVAPSGTSSEQDATVSSSGNEALTFNSPYYSASGATTDFTIGTTSSSACTNSGTVPVGRTCAFGATFTPAADASGALTDSLTFSSNAENGSAEQVVLSGTSAIVESTATTVAITSPSSGSPYAGQPITLSATVTSSTGTPTGSVTFRVDGQSAGTGQLSDGTAALTLANGLNGGSHSIVAVYAGAQAGTTIYGGSTSLPITVDVTAASSVTTLTVVTTYNNPPNDLTTNAVTFTAVVTPGSTEIPTGTVAFMNGTTTLGSAPVQPASGGTFAATFTSTLAAGPYNVVAVYSGDANYDTSSSAAVSFKIVPEPTFTLSQSGTSITSSDGQPGSIQLTLTSWGGWSGLVGLSCSGLPAYAQCVFLPPQPAVYVSTPAATVAHTQFTMEITTDNPPGTPNAAGMAWWAAGLGGLGLFWMRRRAFRGMGQKLTVLLALALLGCAVGGLTSCGSTGPQYMTPGGTSTVTVTATGSEFETVNGGSNMSTLACASSASACPTSTFQVAFTAK